MLQKRLVIASFRGYSLIYNRSKNICPHPTIATTTATIKTQKTRNQQNHLLLEKREEEEKQ